MMGRRNFDPVEKISDVKELQVQFDIFLTPIRSLDFTTAIFEIIGLL